MATPVYQTVFTKKDGTERPIRFCYLRGEHSIPNDFLSHVIKGGGNAPLAPNLMRVWDVEVPGFRIINTDNLLEPITLTGDEIEFDHEYYENLP